MGRARIHLEGMTFGKWHVDEYIGNMKYRCTCECGRVYEVTSKNLRNGISTRCRECYNAERQNQHCGKMYGYWKVLGYAGDKQQKCLCTKCNRVFNVYTESLVSGKSKQCRHCSASHIKNENILTGKTFGKWYVKEYLGSDRYLCECECGTVREIVGDNLRIGHTTQCSKCSNHELIDITNKRFGRFKATEYLGDGKWKCICDCGRAEIVDSYSLRNGSRKMCKACTDNGKSSEAEKEIFGIFDKAIARDRSILKDRELDIYLPEKKLAIEFNGNYWHSSKFKDKYYHYNKSKDTALCGIRLIHIFEYEWNDTHKKQIINKMLHDISMDSRKILYARQLQIKHVNNKDKEEFLQEYHLQGNSASSINLGLYKNDELVQIMTFGKARFSNDDTEIIRLCSHADFKIVGGAEKLFKFFCRNYTYTNIVSYCDISKFTGDVYTKLGMHKVAITEPNYVWVKGSNVLKRYQTQKHILIKNGLGTKNDTEDTIMERLGYLKIYDCGNMKFEYKQDE